MAKSTTAGNGTKAPRTARAPKAAPPTLVIRPSEEQIRERAYLLFLERGGIDGYAEADWLTAEAELLAQQP
jgi:hypothetical protein